MPLTTPLPSAVELESHLSVEHGGAPRCQHILLPTDQKTRAPDRPRQCRAAAERGERFCGQHRRTPDQREADAFDLQLFRLISRAERNAEGAAPMVHRRTWGEVASALRRIRPPVREMMHPADQVAS